MRCHYCRRVTGCEVGMQKQHTDADRVDGVRQQAAVKLILLHQVISGSTDRHRLSIETVVQTSLTRASQPLTDNLTPTYRASLLLLHSSHL